MSAQQPTLKEALNNGNANSLPSALAILKIGTILRSMVTFIAAQATVVPGGDQPQLATLRKLTLPIGAKASTIRRAWSRAGSVTGALTPVAYGVTPTTGQIAVAPNGDIVTLGTDAITSLDVEYEPMRYDVLEYDADVVSNDLVLPAAITGRRVIALLSAEGYAGTQVGKKIVLVDGARSTTDGTCNMNVLKTIVQFDATDAITKARVKVAVMPEADVNALLEAASPGLF